MARSRRRFDRFDEHTPQSAAGLGGSREPEPIRTPFYLMVTGILGTVVGGILAVVGQVTGNSDLFQGGAMMAVFSIASWSAGRYRSKLRERIRKRRYGK